MLNIDEDLEVWLAKKNAELMFPTLGIDAEDILKELSKYRVPARRIDGVYESPFRNVPASLMKKVDYLILMNLSKGDVYENDNIISDSRGVTKEGVW